MKRTDFATDVEFRTEERFAIKMNDPTKATINDIPILTGAGSGAGVTVGGTQTITGAKTFSSTLTTNGEIDANGGIVFANANPWPSPASYDDLLNTYDVTTTTVNMGIVEFAGGPITAVSCDGVATGGAFISGMNFVRMGRLIFAIIPQISITAQGAACSQGFHSIGPGGPIPVGYRSGPGIGAGGPIILQNNSVSDGTVGHFTIDSVGGFAFIVDAAVVLTVDWGTWNTQVIAYLV